eukprot:12881305-Alexandrium_andersonii.AAC.1
MDARTRSVLDKLLLGHDAAARLVRIQLLVADALGDAAREAVGREDLPQGLRVLALVREVPLVLVGDTVVGQRLEVALEARR